MASQNDNRWRDSVIRIPCMASLSVDDRFASSVHGVDEAVDEGHRNLHPYSWLRFREFSCSCRPWSHIIESPLNLVPQLFYRVDVWTEGRSLKTVYAVLTEK